MLQPIVSTSKLYRIDWECKLQMFNVYVELEFRCAVDQLSIGNGQWICIWTKLNKLLHCNVIVIRNESWISIDFIFCPKMNTSCSCIAFSLVLPKFLHHLFHHFQNRSTMFRLNSQALIVTMEFILVNGA